MTLHFRHIAYKTLMGSCAFLLITGNGNAQQTQPAIVSRVGRHRYYVAK